MNGYESDIVYIGVLNEVSVMPANENAVMLTPVTHLCYVATAVTIGILLGGVIGQAKALCWREVNLVTTGRGLLHERLAAGLVFCRCRSGGGYAVIVTVVRNLTSVSDVSLAS